jgi:hypothetical protein
MTFNYIYTANGNIIKNNYTANGNIIKNNYNNIVEYFEYESLRTIWDDENILQMKRSEMELKKKIDKGCARYI